MNPHFFDSMFALQRRVWEEGFHAWSRLQPSSALGQPAEPAQEGSTPHDVVYQHETLRVYRYLRNSRPLVREPVLICYALVNRPYILDLQPQRSVVRRLLEAGLDVYLIDWGVPREADNQLSLQDYVCDRLRRVSDFVCQQANTPRLNLLGYCMGGTMATMFAALYPDVVKNLALLAAPIDFSGEECLLNVWAREQNFDVDRLIDAFGNCPADFLQFTFQLLKPVQSFIEKYVGLAEHLQDEQYVQNYAAMERWTNDNIPVAGETFRQFVKCLYQRNELALGKFQLEGRLVDLRRITCPLLLLTATYDHLVLPAATYGLIPLAGSWDIEKREIAAGHVGLAVSSKAHATFWPQAAQWLVEHSTPFSGRSPAKAPGPAVPDSPGD